MGADKATMVLDGASMAQRAVAAVRAAGVTTVVTVGGDAAGLAGVADDHLGDLFPGEGPLGGVVTAVLQWPGQTFVVVACDLPDLEPALLVQLQRASGARGCCVAVPRVDGRVQWSVAVVEGSSTLRLVSRFESGSRSLRDGYGWAEGEVVEVEVAVGQGLDDLDTPEDVERWRRVSGARG